MPGTTESGEVGEDKTWAGHLARVMVKKARRLSFEMLRQETEAKNSLLSSVQEDESLTEVKLELESNIEKRWLVPGTEIDGNLYFAIAFGIVTWGSLWQVKKNQRVIGLLLIFFIQFFGPPAISLYAVRDSVDFTKYNVSLADWRHDALTKMLAVSFLFCFVLNGFYELNGQLRNWKRANGLFSVIGDKDGGKKGFLKLSAFMDCWLVLWCCLDAYFILGCSGNPREVLSNALGLTFLYTLDDVGGSLGFLKQKDWPAAEFGWLETFVDQDNLQDDDFNRPMQVLFECTKYLIGFMVCFLPLLLAVSPFTEMAH